MLRRGEFRPAWMYAAMLIVLAGCGSHRPTVMPVSGHVYLDGQPVTTGRIDFVPVTGPAATARIQPDGSYQLTTFDDGDGAVAGLHSVRVRAVEVAEDIAATDSPRDRTARHHSPQPPMRWLVPERYARANTSPLSAEIVESRDDLDFHLIGDR